MRRQSFFVGLVSSFRIVFLLNVRCYNLYSVALRSVLSIEHNKISVSR